MTDYYLKNEDDTFISQEKGEGWYIILDGGEDMADQVEIQLPKPTVNEESIFTASAYFRNRSTKAGDLPTTVHYRVDCLSTDTTVTDWTSVTPGNSVDISITSTMNKIQDSAKNSERKQIIVQADRGLSTQVTGQNTWVVKNYRGIS
jgi:hypothetical protein